MDTISNLILRLGLVEVPSTPAEDINPGLTTWRAGRCTRLDEGSHVTLYIAHRDSKVTVYAPDEEQGEERTVTHAVPVRVAKPLTRDMAINAAEMAAYGLSDAMAVASFNAALARKSRENPADAEVIEHDNLIAIIKAELTKIGV
ncbi:MAG: hypothetical protein NC117_10035 [Pseudoflavonifractor sp.]|nr:hypothetical protein [Pseudoflavonifractor sp.]